MVLTTHVLRAGLRFTMNPVVPPPPALVTAQAQATPRLRLFVFPHSGSGAYPYRPMAASLPPWVEVSILQLPGREAMFGSPMFHSMPALVTATTQVIGSKLDLPFAFFGHSLGAHVAFEVARMLRSQASPLPQTMIVSGTRAPHLPLRRKPLHKLPTPEFIQEIRLYGGTPEAVLQNQELMDLFLPPLRADLTVFETHSFAPNEPFEFPIIALGGRNDHRTDTDEIEEWREHTKNSFSIRFFDGGHFYLFEQSKPLFLSTLRATLETLGKLP